MDGRGRLRGDANGLSHRPFIPWSESQIGANGGEGGYKKEGCPDEHLGQPVSARPIVLFLGLNGCDLCGPHPVSVAFRM